MTTPARRACATPESPRSAPLRRRPATRASSSLRSGARASLVCLRSRRNFVPLYLAWSRISRRRRFWRPRTRPASCQAPRPDDFRRPARVSRAAREAVRCRRAQRSRCLRRCRVRVRGRKRTPPTCRQATRVLATPRRPCRDFGRFALAIDVRDDEPPGSFAGETNTRLTDGVNDGHRSSPVDVVSLRGAPPPAGAIHKSKYRRGWR